MTYMTYVTYSDFPLPTKNLSGGGARRVGPIAVVQADNLRKSFIVNHRGQTQKVDAVRGVSLSVTKGDIFGFLGPNGAGKTTTLRMLTTLLPIDDGTATILGHDLSRHPKLVRRHIGYVGQLGGADGNATGRENMQLAAGLYRVPQQEAALRIKELLAAFELALFADRFVRTYSGGQKRRLEIALGMIHRPAVLFLDEPTAGLDPQNRANLWEQIRQLRDGGTTVFLTTHYLQEADALCDRITIIDHGAIVASGTPAELKRQIAGEVIQVRLADDSIMAATSLLDELTQSIEDVLECRVEGDLLYVYANDAAASMTAVSGFLEANHVRHLSFTISAPSLDDVFLKQTGRSLRDGKDVA